MSQTPPPLRSESPRALAAALSPEFVRRAENFWDAGDSAPAPLHAVQNFGYAIESAAGAAILRLTNESHRSLGEVEAELFWVCDLAQRGLRVARPRYSRQDALVETLESNQGRFFATVFERVSGHEPDPKDPEHWNDRMFEQLGSIFAQLHQASGAAGWEPSLLPRRTWREESMARDFHAVVPAMETRVHRAFDHVLAQLDSLPRAGDSFGLIHADLNHANFFISREGLNIFDFDDSCYCWFAYDLIVPIFHFPRAEQAVMNAAAQRALRLLIRGYERVRPFDRAWLEWLPLFFKWRDLLTYAFFCKQLEIAELPDRLRVTFLDMRTRIEAGRPIAQIDRAG